MCKNYCHLVGTHCQQFFNELSSFSHVGTFDPIIIPSNCDNATLTDVMNGGTSPECYMPPDATTVTNTSMYY